MRACTGVSVPAAGKPDEALLRAGLWAGLGEVRRLRAENDRFEAELNFSRAKLEAARAVSRLNQAQGILP